MNRQDYRAAFDAIPFDEDFQEKTINALRQRAGQAPERKVILMKKNRFALIAAALSALLVVSAAAAVLMLSPKDVALHLKDTALAVAFESDGAIIVDETKTVGDYNVTFLGIVSGKNISRYVVDDKLGVDRSYAAVALTRTDGTPIEDTVPEITISPLIEGCEPWRVNAWTLDGGTSSFVQDGILYYLDECDSVECFADHTVYLAAYPGAFISPSAELFDFDETTGAITAKGEAVLFSLPLDKSKADPQKAHAIAGRII